jgi:hypothetical protein
LLLIIKQSFAAQYNCCFELFDFRTPDESRRRLPRLFLEGKGSVAVTKITKQHFWGKYQIQNIYQTFYMIPDYPTS